MRRISRCLLAVVLAAGVATTARAADVDPLLPKETEQVVYMNFKQMLDSDIIKKYAMGQIKQAMQGEDVKGILDSLGLDPLKDLDKATLGLWGSGDETNMVGVVKGKFNYDKLFAAAKEQADKNKDKVEIVTDKAGDKDGEKEVTLVKMTQDSGKPVFLTVADESTILFGSEKKFAVAALTAFNKKEKAKLSKELLALVMKQDDKSSMYYCAVTEGKLKDVPADAFNGLKQLGLDGEKMKEQLEKMNTVAVSLNLGKEVKFAAVMGMKDADSAEEFGGSLDKLIESVKTFLPFLAGSQPKAKSLIDDLTKSIGVKAKEKDVTLSFALTAKAIGDLAGSDE
jgi:hypothetical protein